MSDFYFWLITIIVYFFSVAPFSMVLFLKYKNYKISSSLALISLVEFFTNSSNITLFLSGFGNLNQQYFIYAILEILCWVFLLRKLDSQNRKKGNYAWFFLIIPIPFLLIEHFNYIQLYKPMDM
jgi:hypothetical protein